MKIIERIKELSDGYDKYESVEINYVTGEVYFKPFWFRYVSVCLELINDLLLPLTVKCTYFDKKGSYLLFPMYKFALKRKKGFVNIGQLS